MYASTTKPFARWWLMLGVFSLVASGIPAIALVIARTTGLSEGDMFMRLFHEALVVHVDLSVLVWFLTIACMVWSMEAVKCRTLLHIPGLEGAALGCMAAGALLLTLSPLESGGEALMSNYIPVITNRTFFFGLMLILAGLLLQITMLLLKRPRFEEAEGVEYAMSFGGHSAALVALVALLSITWAYRLMPEVITGQQYYDLLFWAGGHALQFTHTQMLMVAWFMMMPAVFPGTALSRRMMAALLAFNLFGGLLMPFGFVLYDVTSQEFRQFYTHAMMWLNGIGAAGLMGFMLHKLFRRLPVLPEHRAVKAAAVMSLLVFGYGGVLGFMIEGQNVVIPAHYHGSIVGITIAFMGLAYLLLPHFGWQPVAHTRMARWQPVVLGIGQVMHVSGLAYLGGHGVPRKTPGMPDEVYAVSEAALHVMRLGGLLAVAGGVMFVVLVLRAARK